MDHSFSRYRFPALRSEESKSTAVSPAPETVSLAARETVFEQAKADGYRQGLAEGKTEGFSLGLSEGKAQGLAEGRAQGLAESQALFQQASAPLDAAAEQLTAWYAQAEKQQNEATLALVTRIAGLVIRHEITSRPELLLSLIEDKLASEQLSEHSFAVRVAEADFDAIVKLAPEKQAAWNLQSVADLARGECIIDTAEQEIDLGCQQRLNTCLATLEKSLQEPNT